MLDMLMKGGWVMLPLAVCSIIAVTIVIERFYFFRRSGAASAAEKALELLEQGRLEQAGEMLQALNLPLGRVLRTGLEHRRYPVKAMEAAALAEIACMKRGLSALDTIITLSPLLGLLGTIIGMIDSFQVMTLSGASQPYAVTGGVAEALIATAGGITVAVVTLIPYNYFLAQVEQETEITEQYATRLELALANLPQEG